MDVHELRATALRLRGFDHNRIGCRHQGLEFRLAGVYAARVVNAIISSLAEFYPTNTIPSSPSLETSPLGKKSATPRCRLATGGWLFPPEQLRL